jgi:hypothetical protein
VVNCYTWRKVFSIFELMLLWTKSKYTCMRSKVWLLYSLCIKVVYFFSLVLSADRYLQLNTSTALEVAKSSSRKIRILQLLDYYRLKLLEKCSAGYVFMHVYWELYIPPPNCVTRIGTWLLISHWSCCSWL